MSEKTDRMPIKQFRQKKKKHKYSAQKVTVDGHSFDSKLEARYYNEYKLMLRAGHIQALELQPQFQLLEGFRKNGKVHRAIKYIADFKITHTDGSVEIIDIKSKATKTPVYNLKKKLFEYHYPDLTITEKY